MFGSGVLEIAIGMVFVFLSVSLICSAAREALETMMRTRASDLERGIRELLDDRSGTGVTQAFFNHPMIFALFGGNYDPQKLTKSLGIGGPGRGLKMSFWARRRLPSYIPSGQFASAIIDLVARGPVAGSASPYPVPPLSVESLRATADTLPNEKLKRAVLSAIDYAEGDIAKVKANLETWFNGTMDRVSGWYKRRTQIILFGIGLLAAFILNVDAITIAKRLHDDDNLRQAIVAKAAGVAKTDLDALSKKNIKELREGLSVVGVPIGWHGWVPGPQTEKIANCATGKPKEKGKTGGGKTAGAGKTNTGKVAGAGTKDAGKTLAAGTTDTGKAAGPATADAGKTSEAGKTGGAGGAKGKGRPGWSACIKQLGVGGVTQIAIGWLIVAFAVMLGAPFWFDVLSKFMSVRSTLKPTEQAPETAAPPAGQAATPPPPPPPPAGKAPPPIPPGYEPNQWATGPEEGIL